MPVRCGSAKFLEELGISFHGLASGSDGCVGEVTRVEGAGRRRGDHPAREFST